MTEGATDGVRDRRLYRHLVAGALGALLVIGGVAPQSAQAAPASAGITIGDNVRVRTGPGVQYPIIAELQRGTRRTVIGAQGDWYRVATAAGTEGWIAAEFFSTAPAGAQPVQAPEVIATIIDSGVHLRTGPGTDYASLGQLADDSQVMVLDRSGAWYRVRSSRGTLGWVAATYAVLDRIAPQFLLAERTAAAGPGAASPNRDVALLAQQFEGAPYIWGGGSIHGFDCSGFTRYMYQQVGVSLPRKAGQQYSSRYGQRIGPMNALRPGDLVFFERTTSDPGITHAAIYIGNGTLIAARSERLGVRYVNLYEPFWYSRYVGGLRPARN